MPATTGMKGEGFYDQNSAAQQASLRLVLDWIADAVAAMPLPAPPRPFAVLDLGSSEGRNALLATGAVVEAVRRRRPDQVTQTVYSDLAGNNFNQLFRNLHEAKESGRVPPGVFASAVAGSFYEPLMPPGSVHFALAFNALLWMDRLPDAPVPDFVVYRRPHPPRSGLHVPAETAAAFARRADEDLVQFLTCRAREMVPGGKLLVVSPGDAADGRLADGLYDALNDGCLDLVAAGRVDRGRYERFTMPLYFRTVEETLTPLERDGSPVKGLFGVDRAETLEVATPFLVEFDKDGDAAKLAASYTGFVRAFSEPVARDALAGPDGGDEVIDELYERVRARIQAEPERYRFRYFVTATLFTRR